MDLAVDKKIEGMVYVSSMEVYGIPDEKKEYITEKDLGYIELENVRSSYSEGKRICECLCNAYAAEFGLPVKSARLAQTFGAGVLQEDNRVYAQFARSAMKKENLVLRTDGSKRAASGRGKYVSFQRSGADPLSDAVFQSGLPFKA